MATATKSQVSSIDDTPQEIEVPVIKTAENMSWASGDRELLTIYSSNEAGGSDDVECGINGYAFRIKRDTPVNVPTELVGVFRNAIMTHYVDGKAIDRPRYAFHSQPV